jgi:hypothetical protein
MCALHIINVIKVGDFMTESFFDSVYTFPNTIVTHASTPLSMTWLLCHTESRFLSGKCDEDLS